MAQEGLQRSGLDQSGIEVGFRLSPLLHDHLHQDHLGQGGPGVLSACAGQGRVEGYLLHHGCHSGSRILMQFSHIEGGVAPGDRVIIIGNQFLKILRLVPGPVQVGVFRGQIKNRDIFFQIGFGLLQFLLCLRILLRGAAHHRLALLASPGALAFFQTAQGLGLPLALEGQLHHFVQKVQLPHLVPGKVPDGGHGVHPLQGGAA